MKRIVLVLTLLLALCLPMRGMSNGIDDINSIEGRPPPALTSYSYKEDTSWTMWNKVLFSSYVGANGADVYTSQEAFDRGCVEGNPLMPEGTGGMIITKVVMMGVTYWMTEKYLVEAYGTNARNYVYGLTSVFLSGIAVHNNGMCR